MSCIETALSGVWQEALALQGRGSLPNNSNGRLKAAQHEGTVRTAADAGKAPPATADKLNPMSHHSPPLDVLLVACTSAMRMSTVDSATH